MILNPLHCLALHHRSPKLLLTLLVVPMLLSVLLTACPSPNPGVGQVVAGDTLVLRLDDYERTQELRYLGCDGKHYVVTPAEAGNELLMVKLSIWNDRARSVLLTLDAEASELRGTIAQQKFSPVDIDAMKVESEAPTEDEIELERHFARPGAPGGYYHCGEWTTSPEVQFLQASVNLDQENSLSGWIAYEIPVGTQLREIRWGAGDTIYIRFPT